MSKKKCSPETNIMKALMLENDLRSQEIEAKQIFDVIMMFQKQYAKFTSKIQQQIDTAFNDLKIISGGASDVTGLANISSKKIKEAIEGLSSQAETPNRDTDDISKILQSVHDDINGISEKVGRQAMEISSLLSFLDIIHITGEKAVGRLPYVESSVRKYNEINKQTLRNLTALANFLSQEKNIKTVGDKALLMGHDIAYPPWAHIEKGVSAGIGIEHAHQMGKSLERKQIFIADQWSKVYPKLIGGEVDVLISVGWPNRIFNKEPVIASKPYDQFRARLFTIDGVPTTPKDLRGKKVGVQKGSFSESLSVYFGLERVVFENDICGMVQLLWGNLGAVLVEEKVGTYLSEAFFMGKIKSASDVLESLDVVYLFREDSAELMEHFNSFIE